MSSLILIAVAAMVPFLAPLPASLSPWLGPAYLVLFGSALLKAGTAMRRPGERATPAEVEKPAWPTGVPRPSVPSI